MDENRRPGMAGVDNTNNNNNNNGLYGNGIRSSTHNYAMDNYNDDYSYNNDRTRTSSSNGKNNGSPHIDFKALAKFQKKKKNRGMGGPSAVLATRHHNVVDEVDFERNGGVQDGEGVDKHNNLLEVEIQRLQLISPPPEETLRRVSLGSSGVSVLSFFLFYRFWSEHLF